MADTRTTAAWRLDTDLLPAEAGPGLTETVFSLTNGFFGCRGSAPFAPRGTRGTYVNGLYAEAPASIAWIPRVGSRSRDSERFPTDESVERCGKKWALVAAPNLFCLEPAGERPARVVAMAPRLDMKDALLRFDGEVEIEGRAIRVSVSRFLDRTNPFRAFERIRAVDPSGGAIALSCGIDDSVRTWRHSTSFDLWESREFTTEEECIGWYGVTRGHGIGCALACACRAHRGGAAIGRRADGSPAWLLEGAGEIVVDRIVAVGSSTIDRTPLAAVRTTCLEAVGLGYERAFEDHRNAWAELWRRGDIHIEGPLDDRQAVKYSLFQTISSFGGMPGISIGAKFLSHEGYQGGVYWDTDIFVLPYMIRTFPEHARNHLVFRHRGLAAAREKARRYGGSGALYAWSSLPNGEEATAPWLVIDRTQIHVVAAVALGVVEYLRWTGDETFMEQYGVEILAETARFWAGRVERDGGIRSVCGPDENCPEIDNNAYTNRMAAANLRWAARLCGKTVPEQERERWQRTADTIRQQEPGKDGVIEQFDGYHRSGELQRAKQADVLMLPVVFPGLLTEQQIAANFRFYEPRCSHGSSLSEGAYALAAARAGLMEESYELFRRSLFMDLCDLHGNTTGGGLHAGCTGFVPTLIAQGFCGLHLTPAGPAFDVRLPKPWKSVSFTIRYRGEELVAP